ncbi:MAG: hypothetical protein KatS3mg054_1162 [Chloroflexus sp.]|nr:MAG: hypothetical protein KatS3mg054_1162 [Chloroflexus sp.]
MFEDELLPDENLVYGLLFERKLLRNFSRGFEFPQLLIYLCRRSEHLLSGWSFVWG